MYYFSYNENKRHGTLDFPVAHYRISSTNAPYTMPLHWHREWELIRVQKGQFCFLVNGEEWRVGEGEILLLRGGTLHGALSEGGVCECLNFDLHALVLNVLSVREAFRLFYREVYLPRIHYTAGEREFASIVGELFSAFEGNCSEHACRLLTLGNVNRLFALILERELYTKSDGPEGAANDKINLLKPVLEYIEAHFSEEIKLSGLAEIVGMNQNYFCRFFSSLTQQTPMSYVTHYRIEQAANMLLATEHSVTDVAFRCGFNDTGYFIKIFKARKGCTPRQFRLRAQ